MTQHPARNSDRLAPGTPRAAEQRSARGASHRAGAWLLLAAAWGAAPARADVLLDHRFDPAPNAAVQAFAHQPDGLLVIAGAFTGIDGVARTRVARLDREEQLDTRFVPPAIDGDVTSLVALPDGRLLLAGDFATVDGVPRRGLARLQRDGALDATFTTPVFTPSADGRSVFRVLPLRSGKLLVAGHFIAVDGHARSKIARLLPDGALDPAFDAGSFDPGAYLWTLAEQADARILVGGAFSQVDGVPRDNIARLLPDGALDASLDIGVRSIVGAAAVASVLQDSSHIVVGGAFQRAHTGGAATPQHTVANLARFSNDGAFDAAFRDAGASVSGTVHAMALQQDGALLLGGDFLAAAVLSPAVATLRSRLARLHPDGVLDASFDPPPIDAGVWSLRVQDDGRVLFGGPLSQVDGRVRPRLARLFTGASLQPLSDIHAVANGGDHACALAIDGSVACWGANATRQIGDGSTMARPHPVRVPAPAQMRSLTLGAGHSCGLARDDTAYCWGDDGSGQLGRDGDPGSPGAVMAHVRDLAAGMTHTCAVSQAGAAWCWGSNVYGELGAGGVARHTPVPVPGIPVSLTAITSGDGHSCALTGNGVAWCWGWNIRGQLGIDSDGSDHVPPTRVAWSGAEITRISAGALHTCAATHDSLLCWGAGALGQLGNGATLDALVPIESGTPRGDAIPHAAGLRSCARHGALLDRVQCWGANDAGQVGNGNTTDQSWPVDVPGLASGVTALGVGNTHACAVQVGRVRCWGVDLPPLPATPGAGLLQVRWPAYVVTLQADVGGSIVGDAQRFFDPEASQQVIAPGESAAFLVTPPPGLHARIGGDCAGVLVGAVYTLAPVTADCTVQVSFTAQAMDVMRDGFETAGVAGD